MRLILLCCIFFSSVIGVLSQAGDALVVRRILDRYVETLGGPRAVEVLSSLSIEGTQSQGGQRYHFLMRKKRPNSIRYRLAAGDTSIVCGYNGRVGWLRTALDSEVTIDDLSSDQLAVLRDEGDFDSPLFRHLEKSWNAITLLDKERIDGVTVNVLEVRKFGQPFARYYLNEGSGRLLKRVRLNEDGSAGLETLYRDYRTVDGYQFAFEVENRLGGQPVSLVEVEQIEVNPGLLSFYFEKPRN